MKLTAMLWGVFLVLAGIVVGAVPGNPVSAEDQPAPSAPVGRYQMSISTHRDPSVTATTVFVLDTATGQCWYRETVGDRPWTDHGSPATGAKK